MTETMSSSCLRVAMPPTLKDLPSDDGKTIETSSHRLQMDSLIKTLYPRLENRSDGYVVPVPTGKRLSWVVWGEGKSPKVVIKLLSSSTATKDQLTKKLTDQNQVRVPKYFWFDPFNPDDFAGFSPEWRSQDLEIILPPYRAKFGDLP